MADEKEKLILLICSYFLREAENITQSAGYADVEVQGYAPACSDPQQEKQVRAQIAAAGRSEHADVMLVGGCFLAGDRELPCRVHLVPHCFYLIAAPELVDGQLQAGAYLLSPGWLSDWRAHMQTWGFDQATARDFFGESTTSLVLLDTGIDAASAASLQELAAWLDLPCRIIPAGLEHFRLTLYNLILTWRLEKQQSREQQITEHSRRTIADQAMAMDLLVGLTHIGNEEEAINHILKVFDMLFAPVQMIYAAVVADRVENIYALPPLPLAAEECQVWLDEYRDENSWNEAEQGFFLRFIFQEQILGMLEVKEVAFPEHQQEYLNIVAPIGKLCGMAIANARMFQEVRQLAITDALTGLYNRRHFFAEASAEFSRARRYNRPLSLLMLDIDFFKAVNDNYGHAAGDRVLTAVAGCCRETLRSSDICGRYGGEEFVILLPETVFTDARQVAERLRKSIEAVDFPLEAERNFSITVSLGLAVLDPGCTSLEVLLNRSDQALYKAKQSGRNRVCVWNADCQ